jgi:hypothetical protein
MYKLPSQFDAKPAQISASAAGGGSTSTTCSCCVVTLLGANILAARQLAALARNAKVAADATPQTESETKPSTPLQSATPATWGAIGFFIFPLAILVGFLFAGSAGIGGALFALATIVGAFCLAYDKLVSNPKRGALVALFFILGICAASAVEAFLWLGAGGL